MAYKKVKIDVKGFFSLIVLTSMWRQMLLYAYSMHSLTASKWISLDLSACWENPTD